jgi:NAD(P)-dependent dehydrogenase (short-subunit alcohol dehydrogenase family)
VWVTGASRGLGRVIAADLCERGARVAVTARSAADLHGLRDEQRMGAVLCLAGSVTDQDDVDRAADGIDDEWGGLDAVVCCAGSSPNFQSAEDLDPKVWREIIDLNLTGTFLVAQAAARLMTGGGAVVTVSSVHATSGARRLAAYSASKGGVEALTRALALDWAGHGIRVNCLAPGYFETDMTADLIASDHHRERLLSRIPLRTFGDPAHLLATTRLLVGPGSTYITGTTFTVDGGWTIA